MTRAYHYEEGIGCIVERLDPVHELAKPVLWKNTVHQPSLSTNRATGKEACSFSPVNGLDDD